MVSKDIGNIDNQVVRDFGSEWSRFNQSQLTIDDHEEMFNSYFDIFPWNELKPNSIGADIGCGSGRWAILMAPKVGHLHLVDPSNDALSVAKNNLVALTNTTFHNFSVDELPFEKDGLDFAYALGVLHHVPDTQKAIKSIASILKPGAPFLVYLYYAFDNRPLWFRAVWWMSDVVRKIICRCPNALKNLLCDIIAFVIYLPISRVARLLDKLDILPKSWPLSYYKDRSFYVLRTDALDRFGTRLEQRFSQLDILSMLGAEGFERIKFSQNQPHWCVLAYKSN